MADKFSIALIGKIGDNMFGERLCDKGWTARLVSEFDEVLKKLPPVSKEVLTLHWGLGDEGPHTLAEIGERLNMSSGEVGQLETSVLENLMACSHRVDDRQL